MCNSVVICITWSFMVETAEDKFFEMSLLLEHFSVFGGGIPVVMICLVCYVCKKAKKYNFLMFYVTW